MQRPQQPGNSSDVICNVCKEHIDLNFDCACTRKWREDLSTSASPVVGALVAGLGEVSDINVVDLDIYDAVDQVTEVMREADVLFEKSGGSTRHYVRDLLIPMLAEKGLIVRKKLSESKPSPVIAKEPEQINKPLLIANRIRSILQQKGLTQRAFSALANQAESVVSKWLTGDQNFTIGTITEIETVLGEQIILVASLPPVIEIGEFDPDSFWEKNKRTFTGVMAGSTSKRKITKKPFIWPLPCLQPPIQPPPL